MLSKKTKYAIKALVVLAENYGNGPMLITEVAEREHIPHKFLEVILFELRKHGLVASKKGYGGGYYLVKDPSEVKLSQVMRYTGGPIAIVSCASINFYEKCDDCENEAVCGIHQVAVTVRDEMLKILADTSLADILSKQRVLKVAEWEKKLSP